METETPGNLLARAQALATTAEQLAAMAASAASEAERLVARAMQLLEDTPRHAVTVRSDRPPVHDASPALASA